MVTYHYVKCYVSIIIQLEVININVRNLGYLLVNFNYCTSVILIPLLSTDLTLLLWFPNLKVATKWKGQTPAE
jgi:hypothetical protein